ncbi:hypothetical protein RYX36_024775 [Vicia faba]
MDSSSSSLHIGMYPWLAMGHLTAFFHLANKLARKGHKIKFFSPKKAQSKLEPFNLHPQSITSITITVPHVEGLPPNAETTNDDQLYQKTRVLFWMKISLIGLVDSKWIQLPNLFQELILGLELTNLPYFVALKPPLGFATLEEALPEGFLKRVEGRGVVYGGWVQQQLILEHPSMGCFITHCGSGSLSEALVNKCQLVLLPNIGDQIFNARMMSNNLKVGVEVEKGEDGLYTKDDVCKAVSIVMDDDNEISKKVKASHVKIRDMLLNKDLESSCIDNFCKKLQEIVEGKN